MLGCIAPTVGTFGQVPVSTDPVDQSHTSIWLKQMLVQAEMPCKVSRHNKSSCMPWQRPSNDVLRQSNNQAQGHRWWVLLHVVSGFCLILRCVC